MRIVDWKWLKEVVPYSRQHIARLEKDGRFPKWIRLGPARVGWLYDEVMAWLQERISQRDTLAEASE